MEFIAPILRINETTERDRIYPGEVVAKAVEDFNRRIDENGPVPQTLSVNEFGGIELYRVSHLIERLEIKDGQVFATMKTLNTVEGHRLQDMIDDITRWYSYGYGKIDHNGCVFEYDIRGAVPDYVRDEFHE